MAALGAQNAPSASPTANWQTAARGQRRGYDRRFRPAPSPLTANPGSRPQTGHRSVLFRQHAELPLQCGDASLDRAHLVVHGGEHVAKMRGQHGRRILQNVGIDVMAARAPAGRRIPCSRRIPRSVLIRAVRVVIHCSRTRCRATSACCSTRFTATVGTCPERTASRIASASARSVLLRRTHGRTYAGGTSVTRWPCCCATRPQ